MNRYLLFIFLAIFSNVCYAQIGPLILKGRLENCPEKQLRIFFQTPEGDMMIDTIPVKEDGSFYYKTLKCKFPQETSIQQNSTQINGLLLAPGYDLTITGDARDSKTLFKTTVISGKGSCINTYREKIAGLYTGENHPVDLYSLDSASLIINLDKQLRSRDSVASVVFDHCSEPYAAFFKKIKHTDEIYLKYYYILDHANYSKYSAAAYRRFIENNIPADVLKNPGKDELLNLSNYQSWFLGSYTNYLQQRAIRADSNILVKDKDFMLKEISRIFRSKVRQYILFWKYSRAIGASKTMAELTGSRHSYEPFLKAYISNDRIRKLQKIFTDKYNFFKTTKAGMQAPDLVLPDSNGVMHRLSDFAGRVIYIDFWASWCIPCRNELPALKQLVKKYEKDDRLKFISVAVFDGKPNWLQALQEDKPEWLQLRDEYGKANQDYKTNTIPRYAIIDKKGNIVTIDAPQPGSAALGQLIDAELKK